MRQNGDLEMQTVLGNLFLWNVDQDGKCVDWREASRRILGFCENCHEMFCLLLPEKYVHDDSWEKLGDLIVEDPMSITVEQGTITVEKVTPAPPSPNLSQYDIYLYNEQRRDRKSQI